MIPTEEKNEQKPCDPGLEFVGEPCASVSLYSLGSGCVEASKGLMADPTTWIVKIGENNQTPLPALSFQSREVLMALVCSR